MKDADMKDIAQYIEQNLNKVRETLQEKSGLTGEEVSLTEEQVKHFAKTFISTVAIASVYEISLKRAGYTSEQLKSAIMIGTRMGEDIANFIKQEKMESSEKGLVAGATKKKDFLN